MGKVPRLSEEEIAASLQSIDGWTIANEKLHKEFRFKDFVEAFGFMTKVALISENLCHHPEWFNVWNKVTIDLTTHDAGGISEKDFQFAKLVDKL